MNDSGNKYCAVTAGDVSVAGPGRIWKFITGNFVAEGAMIQSKTS
jgi:hypothetical protein